MEDIEELQFLNYILSKIVDDPDSVNIERTVDEAGVLLSVKVAKSDMGKLIGKDGKMAKAIRSLLKLLGAKQKKNIRMSILEPDLDS